MPKEPKKPSRGPSPEPSRGGRKGRRGNPDKLVPGVKPGQERGPDGKLLPKEVPEPAVPPPKKLTNDVQDVLDAMRHVHRNGPDADTTYQQDHLRRWMLGAPSQFHDRLLSLEDEDGPEQPDSGGPPGWDGTGPCPTCNREPERPLEDPTTEGIIKMIDRLTEAG